MDSPEEHASPSSKPEAAVVATAMRERSFIRAWWRKFWRISIGSVVVVAGVIMLVTPGPGIVGIIAGLAIMADEFPPARRALDWMRARYEVAKDAVLEKASRKSPKTDEPGEPDDKA